METIFSIIIDFFLQHKSIIALYFLLGLSTPIISVALPHYYGKILGALQHKKPMHELKPKFIQLVALWITAQVFYSAMDRIDKFVLPKLQAHVRTKLVELVIEHTKFNFQEISIGDIISKLLKVPVIVKELFTQIRYVFLPSFMTLFFSVMYFFYVNPKLGFLSCVIILLGIFILYKKSKYSFEISKQADTSQNNLFEEISDILVNVHSIHTACTQQQETENIHKYTELHTNIFSKVITESSSLKLLFNTYYIFLMIMIVGYSIYLNIHNEISTDRVASIIIIVLYLINQLSTISGEIRDLVIDIGIIKQINQTLEHIYTDHTSQNGTIKSIGNSISFESVWFRYSNTTPYILRNLSLSILPNEKVCIVGKIGTGKSTFIDLLLRFRDPTNGKILINHIEIKDIDIHTLRRGIGYIPQDTRLFNRTVLDNILYGTDKTKTDALDLIRLYNIQQLPDLDRYAGKYGEMLSGGQKQLVHLLRCLLKDTPIIVLDEPTASVDWETKQDILSIIRNIHKTIVIVSHDPDVMTCCHRLISSSDFSN
jgi:ABC-type multidrug transport system fused ATPase/permease subunit